MALADLNVTLALTSKEKLHEWVPVQAGVGIEALPILPSKENPSGASDACSSELGTQQRTPTYLS